MKLNQAKQLLSILSALVFSLSLCAQGNLVRSEVSPSQCCDLRIYGDSLNNGLEVIKSWNGYTYILGYVEVNGNIHALFSKFQDNGTLIWQYRTDMPVRLFDFIATQDSAFMLVGRIKYSLLFGYEERPFAFLR